MILGALMAHQRKLIRDAVIAALTGTTAAGARVSSTRVDPHKRGELPAISVYTLREPISDVSDTAPRELTRDVKVEIVGSVASHESDTLADAMDDLAEQIETAIDADPYLDGAAADSVLEGTTIQVLEDNGGSSPLVGIITLTYAVTYRTSPAAPTLDDFRRVGATHQAPGAVDSNAAHDRFAVQEAP